MGIVSSCIVGLIDQLDFFDEFLFRVIKVGVGGVDYHSGSAGFGDGLRAGVEFFDGLELVFLSYRHY